MPEKKDEPKRSEVKHGVYRVGDMYYCARCHTVVKFGEACPNCLTEFDWDKIKLSFQ